MDSENLIETDKSPIGEQQEGEKRGRRPRKKVAVSTENELPNQQNRRSLTYQAK